MGSEMCIRDRLNMDKLVDPQNDLVEGLVIRIATADRVFGELL